MGLWSRDMGCGCGDSTGKRIATLYLAVTLVSMQYSDCVDEEDFSQVVGLRKIFSFFSELVL